jgi:hypothetical protein
MWETDFPHPTCQHPGLEGGLVRQPAVYVETAFAELAESTIEKILSTTAARLYKVD